MALTMKQVLRRHGAFVSAVTALGVGGVILVQGFASLLVNWVTYAALAGGIGFTIGAALPSVFIVAVSVALGVFLSLWLVAPIAEELRLPHVITRSVLAAGIGATVYFIVRAVLGIIGAIGWDGRFFGNSLRWPTFDGGLAVSELSGALTASILQFISVLPLAVLAGVLLWSWRKDHPPKKPLAGLIDEV